MAGQSSGMKVAICVPAYSGIKTTCAYSISQLLIHSVPRHEMTPIYASGALLPQVRTEIVNLALAWPADWLLWIDADMVFPADALERLLATGKEVVGCNYPRRAAPTSPTAKDMKGRDVWPLREKAEHGELEQVRMLGLGLCLMRADVFRRLPKPWFQVIMGEDELLKSEDLFLCDRLTTAGIPIHIDHSLSWEVKHLHECQLTNEIVLSERGVKQ